MIECLYYILFLQNQIVVFYICPTIKADYIITSDEYIIYFAYIADIRQKTTTYQNHIELVTLSHSHIKLISVLRFTYFVFQRGIAEKSTKQAAKRNRRKLLCVAFVYSPHSHILHLVNSFYNSALAVRGKVIQVIQVQDTTQLNTNLIHTFYTRMDASNL